MERKAYFDFIEKRLSYLADLIKVRGRLNLLDLNQHAENFCLHFLNLLYGWQFKNINVKQPYMAGFDLIDVDQKIIVQVSATATKRKIESSLQKIPSRYKGYSFKFISISKEVNHLRKIQFSNPHDLVFSPSEDIFDITSLLKDIGELNIERLKQVYDLIKKEIKFEPDLEKMETNLAAIIQILARENWNEKPADFETVPFDIEEKISCNNLNSARYYIDDHKIHSHRIEKIYSDFDQQGANKSFSILNSIRKEYRQLRNGNPPDQCFFSIISNVTQTIRNSANFKTIPGEELDLCVEILVVDAFMRCKIFENPSGESNAHS